MGVQCYNAKGKNHPKNGQRAEVPAKFTHGVIMLTDVSQVTKARRVRSSHILDSVKVDTLESAGLLCDVQTITPEDATRWLKSNKHNRPVRAAHVKFLASQITSGQWQLNGQAIIVSENDDILDGQHRLFAIVEAGIPIKSLVIYGISFDAFKTIDTGSVRTGADALALWHPEANRHDSKSVASAVKWCLRMEKKFFGSVTKISNTDVLQYVSKHKSLWRFAQTISSYPQSARPLSIAMGVALYEIFSRKDESAADEFIRALFTGEGLTSKDPEYVVRNLLIKDANRNARYPTEIRMKMVCKAWNLRRRGREANTINSVLVRVDDPEKMDIL
jgi:hypothetical protein